jgi:hypothetical protein
VPGRAATNSATNSACSAGLNMLAAADTAVVGGPPGAVAVPAQIGEHETVRAADRRSGRDELVAGSGQCVQRQHDRPVAVAVFVVFAAGEAEPDVVAGDLPAPEPGIHGARVLSEPNDDLSPFPDAYRPQ